MFRFEFVMPEEDFVAEPVSFYDLIIAADFNYIFGYAETPFLIRGQTPHVVTAEVEIHSELERMSVSAAYSRFGERIATLSEFLDFAVRKPDVQRFVHVSIVWRDETGQFWFAVIDSLAGEHSGKRLLNIEPCSPDEMIPEITNTLCRKG